MGSERALDWRLVAALFAIIAAAFVVRTLYNAESIPLIADTDDAMRLVVVRDLLAGQAWYDPVQHRMNTPFGAEMHWSRLADLPLAGALLVLRPLFGGAAETVAAYVLPLIWLLLLLILSARLTIKLVGREGLLPALALPAFSLSVLGEFAPGRLDHHSLQILLLLTMAWCAIEAIERPRFSIGAGLAAAMSLALGVEGIPSVAAAALAFGLVWVLRPDSARMLRGFGASLGGATPVLMALTLEPSRWLVPACDAISVVYASAALMTGTAFAFLSMLRLRSPLVRLIVGTGLGAVVIGCLAVAFPMCLAGPYGALDPWLIENWIDKITEALPVWLAVVNDPVYPLAVSIPPLIAVVVAGYRLARTRGLEQSNWLVYLIFLAVAVVVMVVQIRASRMVTSLAVPAGAWLIVAARERYLERQTLPRVGGLLLSWIGSAGIAVAVVVMGMQALLPGLPGGNSQAAVVQDRRRCIMPEAYGALAAIPPQRIMAPIDLGSHLLAFTPHHVVAAPYHRNQGGVLDAFAFFNGPIEDGRGMLDRRGVSLVVICDALPEMRGRADADEESFVRLVKRGALPDWLVETSAPGAVLRVFAVLPK